MEPLYIAGAITAGTTALAGLVWLGRSAARVARSVGNIADDWRGEPARQGVPARPGVMERLKALEDGQSALVDGQTDLKADVGAINKELHPNGGSSLRDAVNRVEKSVNSQQQQQPVQVNVGIPPAPSP